MKLFVLKETNSFGKNGEVAAVCTTLEKAIEMLKEWYEEQKADRTKLEECDCILDIDETTPEFSSADIQSKESRAWESMEIEVRYSNQWFY